ncbi:MULTISPECIES: bacillithiol system redox-active protein YtxJ [Brevibacillus]|uniref:Bacillithiol system redox-active protein YtxJ n=1 Tax=Brevibacillus brevis TaxID=1393 RepID=A0A2Z4MM39_BREBE|nr:MULTISPECIES: bacillithiol system redox-active protein YtxJ [Brevibacillus]AWX57441.1 bacillithiol system redox-active protein YtxJ [Brevibacillus brevis]NRR24323.1 bacillithiol system redox-active protein YtxJ [Brevibacillus sp. MS2.2]
MSQKQLHSIEELDEFVAKNGKRLLFKHSTICPISTSAYEEFQAYLQDNQVESAVILVREDRPVSNAVADRFSIKHESPQIFLLEDGEVKWHTSHWKITKDAIGQALNV